MTTTDTDGAPAAQDGVDSDPVLAAPGYAAMRARAAEVEAEPDPVPELGRQGRDVQEDERDDGAPARGGEGGGANAYALKLLHRKPAVAPDLSRYPGAVDVAPDGTRALAAPVGQVVVYNVHASAEVLPGRPYLKTVKGRITGVDEDGVVSVRDVDRKQHCCFSLATHDPAHVRWPGRRIWEAQQELMARAMPLLETGDPEDSTEAMRLLQQAKGMEDRVQAAGTGVVAKRKVGRPRRQRTAEELERQRLHEERRARGEVKRGRPKGSKNRDQAVIDAEKAQRRSERQARKGAR